MSSKCKALQGGPALIFFDLFSSITLVGEADRKMLKAAVKSSPAEQVRHRVVPQEAVVDMAESLAALKEEIVEVLREEKEEKAVSPASLVWADRSTASDGGLRLRSCASPTWRSERERT